MMRILNAEPANYCAEARHILATIGEVHESALSRDELIAELPGYDVLIVRLKYDIDRQVLEAGSRLKAIVSATTGLAHIDLDHAARKNIAVLSLKGEQDFLRSIPATAELTWGLLLALVRHIPVAFQSVCRGNSDRNAFLGHDLCGKNLGIVGLGRIGEKVARYGRCFGMTVHAWEPRPRNWPEGLVKHPSLERLLEVADVLTLHAPLKPETEHMIATKELALLPNNAVLINTSRGELVDSQALLHALELGQLAGAALDTLPGEREENNRARLALIEYARGHSNLLLTPHTGGATVESMASTEIFMARKLANWIQENKRFTGHVVP